MSRTTHLISILFTSIGLSLQAPALPSLNLLAGNDGYLLKEYINAITAYGPGLGVYSPYSYVDIAYDNIPFVGKIPLIGKEGTSSRLGISPFYPPEGNPSVPWPPIYKARPLPLHVPEPQDVVAVPLDEEALHGEPLFPPELLLPGEQKEEEMQDNGKETETIGEKPQDPFSKQVEVNEDGENEETGLVEWPGESFMQAEDVDNPNGNGIDKFGAVDKMFVDNVKEKPLGTKDAAKMEIGPNDRPRSPFRSRRILMFD